MHGDGGASWTGQYVSNPSSARKRAVSDLADAPRDRRAGRGLGGRRL